jgi:malonate decarboxylase beta subunit
VLIGGANGCFGGMGIVARCADFIVMSDAGRLAMSGPEVIEASHGVEEFDSRDRALVWRTTGGKHRWLMRDCDALVEDDVEEFRAAAVAALGASKPLTLDALEEEHTLLTARLHALPADLAGRDEATQLWRALGIADAERVPDLPVEAVRALRAN